MSFDQVKQYTVDDRKLSSASKKQKKTSPSAEDQIQSMRTKLRKATNFKSVMAAVTQPAKSATFDEPQDETDWFKEFANSKKDREDALIAKYI